MTMNPENVYITLEKPPINNVTRKGGIPSPPFVAVFHTPNAWYVYDVITNEFFRTTKEFAACVPYCDGRSSEEVRKAIGFDIDKSTVESILNQIRTLQHEKGYFLSSELQGLAHRHDAEQVGDIIDNQLEQLILCVTERCNLDCRYCIYSGSYHYQRQHSGKSMGIDIALKAVDFYLAHSKHADKRHISFYGGEPLLNLKLIKAVISYIEDMIPSTQGIKFNLTTNGVLLKGDILDYLVSKGISILISLDGPKEIHDRDRIYRKDKRGTFQDIYNNLIVLKEKYPEYFEREVTFAATVSQGNKLRTIYEFYRDDPMLHSTKHVVLNAVDPLNNDLVERDILSEEQFDDNYVALDYIRLISQGEEPNAFLRSLYERNMIMIHQRPSNRLGHSALPNGICTPGARRLFCATDGSFQVCEKVNPGLTIGHVDRGIDVEKVNRIIDDYIRMSEPDCMKCWAVRMCGLCFACAFTEEFSIENKRIYCEQQRETLLRDMAIYCNIRERNNKAFAFIDGTRFD